MILFKSRPYVVVLFLLFIVPAAPNSELLAQQGSLESLDTDSNGKVTLKEFEDYARSKLPDFQHLSAFAKKVDSDGNGEITASEFQNRREALSDLSALSSTQESKASDQQKPKREMETADNAEYPSSAAKSILFNGATILLITADELSEAWSNFAQWKTLNGKATKIVTVAEIEDQYEADSIQEKIRLCVRYHIDNHKTRFVILGGDCTPEGGLVPGGHTTVHRAEPKGIPTDIVYLSKTNWDADGDGVYGEFKDDSEAISYPDGNVGLGRVPVRTADDVAAFTAKVIAYESDYPTGDFAKQMIYTCTDSPAYPKVRMSWDGYVSKAWQGGEAGRFFSDETPWDKDEKPGSHALNPNNLVDLINGKSTSKLHIHGHGSLPVWYLEKSEFTDEHVAQLNNKGAYPLITTVSCNTGEYDSRKDPSIVESMIRQPAGGSVAIVAPIRTGKPHFHSPSDFRLMVSEGKLDGTTQTMTRYWTGGLGEGLTTGESLMKAKSSMVSDARKTAGYHLCICELNLLGDPTLDMRANPPRSANFEVPTSIKTGQQKLTVTSDAPESTICIWKGDEIYEVATADSSGNAVFSITPQTPGEINVTVAGRCLNSTTQRIVVK
jgi:hypothetical protein